MVSERVPPHDLGAERGLLGAMLDNPHSAQVGAEMVSTADFYDRRHAMIFNALVWALEDRTPTDALAIGARLARTSELVAVGGAPYLHDLVSSVPIAASAGWYARIVVEAAQLRRLVEAGTRIVQVAMEPGRDPGDVAALAAKMLAEASDVRSRTDLRPVGELLDPAIQAIEDAAKAGRTPGLSTGVAALDEMTGGLRKDQLWYVAGRPGFGKSVFVANVARLAALKAGRNVAYITLEMGGAEQVHRWLAAESSVSLGRITRGRLSDNDWAGVATTAGQIDGAPLWVDDTAPATMADIAARARRLHSRVGLDLLVIDYLQLIKPPHTTRRDEIREQQVSAMSRELKLLAKELHCPVLVPVQLNRGPEQRTDHRPILSDLRESGSLEQDADIVILLYRDIIYNPKTHAPKELELIVGKHRNGPTGTVVALDEYEYGRIYDPGIAPVRGKREE